MEFKGTKGKIKVTEVMQGIAKGIYLSGENQKFFIAQIITHDRNEEENLANAVLFSKAPEMLEMLNKVAPTLERYGEIEQHKKLIQLIKEATEINEPKNGSSITSEFY